MKTAVAGAQSGLSEEDARKMADTAAAKARREAEGELKKLQDELAKSTGNADKAAELEKQIAEQGAKLAANERMVQGIKAFAGSGLTVAQAEFLLQHPTFQATDFAKPEAVTAAIDSAKALGIAPASATPPPPPPPNGLPKPPDPSGTPATPSLRAGIQAEYTKT